jgi:hypothetical protein
VNPHPDFAVPVTHRLFLDTDAPRPDGDGMVSGQALALGWYVDAGARGEPDGTLYLIADMRLPRPVWVTQSRLAAVRT